MSVNGNVAKERMFLALCLLFFAALSSSLGGCRRWRRAAPAPRRAVVAVRDAAVDAQQAPTTSAWQRARFPVFDVHTHLDTNATTTILGLFDQRNIQYAINLSAGLPGEGGGLTEALQQGQQSNGRILSFCTLPWRYAPAEDFPTVSVRILEDCRRAGARGLKIPKVLGLGARDSDGSRLRVDAPRLDPIFEACGRLGLVVLIHSGDPRAFFEPATPQNERWEELSAHPAWSFHGPQFPTFDEIISEYERRVLRHPNTTFIGAHFGNASEDPERVGRLLERAPNLYIDTAARIPEFGRHPAEQMRAFFLRWQDRILFGTDLGLGAERANWMLGSTGPNETTEDEVERFFTASFRYFEASMPSAENPTPIQGRWPVHPIGLPDDVLRKIYGGNAARLFHIPWPPPG